MNIFILSLGSRGDVQPYVALSKGLKAAGHTVTLYTSFRFKPFITEHGLNYGYMNDELMKLMDSDEGRDAMETAINLWGLFKTWIKLAKKAGPMQRMMLNDGWESTKKANPDLILFHPKAYGGVHYAEKLGIPVMMATPLPIYVPTTAFPNMGFPDWKLGGWYNKWTYTLVHRLTRWGGWQVHQ